MGAIVGAAVALRLTGPAWGQIGRFGGGLQPPDLLGHVGKPFAAETGGWDLTLEVGYSRTVYAFHLARMRILNSGRLPDSDGHAGLPANCQRRGVGCSLSGCWLFGEPFCSAEQRNSLTANSRERGRADKAGDPIPWRGRREIRHLAARSEARESGPVRFDLEQPRARCLRRKVAFLL